MVIFKKYWFEKMEATRPSMNLFKGSATKDQSTSDNDSEELQRLWEALTSLQSDCSSVIRLPSDVNCLVTPGEVAVPIYVRRSYKTLFAYLYSEYKCRARTHFLLTGNPGIGKTWFSLYCLYRFSQMGNDTPPLVVNFGNAQIVGVFVKGRAIRASSMTDNIVQKTLREEGCVYLVDGVADPARHNCFTIFTVSPDHSKYGEYLKVTKAFRRFLFPWSLEEIQECRALCYPDVSQDLAEEFFRYFGGTVRYVLGKASVLPLSECLQDLEQALAKVDIQQVKDSIGNFELLPGASHRLLHLVLPEGQSVDDIVISPVVQFASPYVARAVAQQFHQHHKEMTLSMVNKTPDPRAGGLHGLLYEEMMLCLMQIPGSFTLHSCALDCNLARKGTEPELRSFSISRSVIFSAPEELCAFEYGVLCIPLSRTSVGYDAFILPNTFLQIGVQKSSKGVNPKAMRRVCDMLQIENPVLILGVPQERFESTVKPGYWVEGTKLIGAKFESHMISVDIQKLGVISED
eukprot:CAMPEP_0184673574 /NCGR_PEP_ID=MMETSP0308-20130426/86752_1 /TAXON_ID=38269 /ORGANISM="Gloeochaete witrockiana, Strain SAG 46.84" /LENGTH=516 /DNA_ID=CAMNT_0027121073 /DNA_START=942 /DNA_END=2492 /DNA_ORIENTATION=-